MGIYPLEALFSVVSFGLLEFIASSAALIADEGWVAEMSAVIWSDKGVFGEPQSSEEEDVLCKFNKSLDLLIKVASVDKVWWFAIKRGGRSEVGNDGSCCCGCCGCFLLRMSL